MTSTRFQVCKIHQEVVDFGAVHLGGRWRGGRLQSDQVRLGEEENQCQLCQMNIPKAVIHYTRGRSHKPVCGFELESEVHAVSLGAREPDVDITCPGCKDWLKAYDNDSIRNTLQGAASHRLQAAIEEPKAENLEGAVDAIARLAVWDTT